MDKKLRMIVSFKTQSYIKNGRWIHRGQNKASGNPKLHRIGSPSVKDNTKILFGFYKRKLGPVCS